ncbi:cullin-2 isoform X1 [Anopheles merus]|uniref:cullin-2 isoform X1 n=1 Tax=Anopheles merus TaxID=30066 RepID=UPI001BE410CE|nr:cullin-2 isoform X1 [Anopheles merus]XP_041760540.1 cullin-2 isoform X1 [Anopheles merus]
MSLKPRRIAFDEVWKELRETVQQVITLQDIKRDVWNNRFVDVYEICVAHPEPLADRLYLETKTFLENHVQTLLEERVLIGDSQNASNEQSAGTGSSSASPYLLLERYYDVWMEYSSGSQYLNHLYLYLNQQHIKKQKLNEAEAVYGCSNHGDNQEKMEIGELTLEIWNQYMIQRLGNELVDQILSGINAERVNNSSGQHNKSTEVIRGVIQSFVAVQEDRRKGSLKLYQELFETRMLEESGQNFRIVASELLQVCSVSQYMERIIKKFEEEEKLAKIYLHESSLPKLRKVCEEEMVTKHMNFLYSECKEMVATEKSTDLRNLYILLKPVTDGLKRLIEVFLEHIKEQGKKTISCMKGDSVHIQFVENMLDVHRKYEELIHTTFKSDPLFLGALDKACARIINEKHSNNQVCRSAELVAKYCDSLLKKSKTTEGEIDQKLTRSIIIFKYIEDKDVYQKFYSRMLAKRLIHEQSQSMDAEELMINKLKQACGYEFTNKLHRMFTDISVSTDLNAKFSKYLNDNKHETGINFSVKVLQAGAWPLGPTQVVASFAIPQEFEKSIRLFEEFYHINFSGRKLTWLHHLCHGEMKLSFEKRNYIVTMQTYQMAILLMFENTDKYTCKELQTSLQLQQEIFQRHLQSLVEAKILLLNEEKMNDDTEVSINVNYSNKRTKFKITTNLQKETPQEVSEDGWIMGCFSGLITILVRTQVEHTMNAVDEDRKMYLQAAIVRIMKSRKVLRHNTLIQEILSQSKVSFAPNVSMIKKCIESLIDKQYIERTPNSGDEYSYVA